MNVNWIVNDSTGLLNSVDGLQGLMMFLLYAFGMAMTALLTVDLWKIFNKAGERGWKVLIPFYGAYTEYKVAWKPVIFWIMLGLSVVCTTGMVLTIALNVLWPLVAFSAVTLVIALVFDILLSVHLGRRFGKSGGFIFGMIMLPMVFMTIMAFDHSNYDLSRDC